MPIININLTNFFNFLILLTFLKICFLSVIKNFLNRILINSKNHVICISYMYSYSKYIIYYIGTHLQYYSIIYNLYYGTRSGSDWLYCSIGFV